MQVDIKSIWISPGHDFKGRHGQGRLEHGVESREKIFLVAGKGIVGDRYFDYEEDFKGQMTFFAEEVAAELEQALNLPGTFDRALMRRNVLIAGLDLNTLIGKHFKLGPVELTGSEECAPCYWMDEAVGAGAHEWLKGRGGLRCRIVTDGELSTGTLDLDVIGDVS